MSPVGSRLEAASIAEHIATDILTKALDAEGLRDTLVESMASVLSESVLEGEPEDMLKVVEKVGKKQVALAVKEHLESVPRLALMVAGVVRAKYFHQKAVDEFFAGRDR